jgi:N-acyl-D-amino-acid deacylase
MRQYVAELAWLKQLAKETGRPAWFLLVDRYDDPGRWRRLLDAVHAASAEGAQLTAQVPGRPIGILLGIGTRLC